MLRASSVFPRSLHTVSNSDSVELLHAYTLYLVTRKSCDLLSYGSCKLYSEELGVIWFLANPNSTAMVLGSQNNGQQV